MGFGLHECDWVGLDVFGLVFASMGVHVVRVEVSSVDQSTVNWMGVSPAVVLEGWFAEVSGESAIRNPPCGLLELSKRVCYVLDKLRLIVLRDLMILQFLLLEVLTVVFILSLLQSFHLLLIDNLDVLFGSAKVSNAIRSIVLGRTHLSDMFAAG